MKEFLLNSKAEGHGVDPDRLHKRRRKKFRILSIGNGIDVMFFLLVLAVLIIGLVMMFSASFPVAYFSKDSSYYFIKRQVIFALIGVGVMIGLSFVDYHHYHKLALPAFALILFLAHWSSLYYDKMKTFKYGVAPGIVLLVVTSFLLYLEPHYSGIVICGAIIAIMLFLAGVPLRYFGIAGAGGIGIISIMAVTGKLTYAMARLDGWGQALEYTTVEMWNTTWQTRNSLYAIGSGGLWGLGLGQSRQKYMYLPEPQNDFVFAISCEELGFIGASLILLLFAVLVWRGLTICLKATDKFGTLLGVGLMAQIGLQVVLNILVITDWLPNTGISLPFFSYGGSSLIMLLAQMGIVMNISRSAAVEKQ